MLERSQVVQALESHCTDRPHFLLSFFYAFPFSPLTFPHLLRVLVIVVDPPESNRLSSLGRQVGVRILALTLLRNAQVAGLKVRQGSLGQIDSRLGHCQGVNVDLTDTINVSR